MTPKIVCNQGFEHDIEIDECIRINQCLNTPCEPNSECFQFEQSYRCVCQEGYTNKSDDLKNPQCTKILKETTLSKLETSSDLTLPITQLTTNDEKTSVTINEIPFENNVSTSIFTNSTLFRTISTTSFRPPGQITRNFFVRLIKIIKLTKNILGRTFIVNGVNLTDLYKELLKIVPNSNFIAYKYNLLNV